jgi:hypothetical protein
VAVTVPAIQVTDARALEMTDPEVVDPATVDKAHR